MSEWWTYRVGSFLLFSARTYDGLVERYNADVWPLQWLAVGAGLAALAVNGRARSALFARIAAAVLSGAWFWVAWSFQYRRFMTINWAAEYVAWAFAVEGAALFWIGVILGRIGYRPDASSVRVAGAADVGLASAGHGAVGRAIVLFALLGYPLIAVMSGRPWAQAEVFGVMPDPTAIATVGFLLLAHPTLEWLIVIPVLYCAIAGAMLWALHVPTAGIAPLIAVIALGCVWQRRGTA